MFSPKVVESHLESRRGRGSHRGGVKTQRREGEGEETTKEGEALEGVARGEEEEVVVVSGAVGTHVGVGATGD